MEFPSLRRGLASLYAAAAVAPLAFAVSVVSAPAAAEQADNDVIEEVVVTSRRRAESVQDVPVAVTAFRQEDIERIAPRTLRDFDGLAPNMFVGMNTAGPGAGAIFIRGLGYADIEKTQSPAVGVILDGIVQATSTGQLIDAFDMEQLEVNRGPQGVLFGKNTTGGTLVVNRTKPTGEWGLRTQLGAGNFDERVARAVANAPLIEDTLALKVGGTYREREGFYTNINQNNDDRGAIDYMAGTVSMLWTPNEQFEAQLTYDKIVDRSDIPPQDPRYNGNNPFVNEADLLERSNYTYDTWGLQAEWDLGWATLYSVTGYQEFEDSVIQDFDGANRATSARPLVQLHTFRDQSYEQWSQEFRLAGDLNEAIRYNVGFFYLESEQTLFQNSKQFVQIDAIPGVPCAALPGFVDNPNPNLVGQFCQLGELESDQNATHDVESLGLFANFDWQLTEQLEFSFGARYIDEEKDFSNAYVDTSFGGNVPGTPVTDDDSWDDLIIKTTLSWQPTDASTYYLSYAEGFRSGGFSIRATGQVTCPLCTGTEANAIGTVPATGDVILSAPNTFDPEEVWTAEIGAKLDFFDGRLRTNFAAFHTELDGQQISSIITTTGIIPGTNTLINNADTTEIKGVEAEITWLAHEYVTFMASGGWQDAERESFSIDGTLVPVGPGGAVGAPGPAVIPAEQVSRSPDYNWALSMLYAREIGPGMLEGMVTYRGQDDFPIVSSITGVPVFEKGYELVDASVGYTWTTADGARLRLSAFGKNIGDVQYREQSLPLGPFGGFQGWGAPRTAGIQFDYEI
jgi:iron complex outermembrane receptor protein